MNPHISVPRQHAGPVNFGSTPRHGSSVRMPRFFKRFVSTENEFDAKQRH